jgi:opacity protein-like surface antigen
LVVIAMALACGAPALASAQGASAPQGFVGGLGGVTFGTVTSAAVAGQGGVRIAPDLYVIGEVGYMRNVLPKKIRDEFDDLVDEIELEAGVPVSLSVSIPAKYGFGGLRWSPSRGAVSPFVEGGVGVAHVNAKVDEATVLGIDISDEVKDGIGDDASATKFLFALGGGVNARISSALSADVGFRYTRIATDDPAINSSLLYGALKVGF